MSVSFQLNRVKIKKKTRPSEERESQILTKYLVSFIIISPSTLSWFRHLNKIDDSRCFPLFHTFCALGSVSNMDLLYLFAIHLAAVCHYLNLLCIPPPTCSGHLVFSLLVSHSWKMWGLKNKRAKLKMTAMCVIQGGFQRRYNVVSLRSNAWKGCCSIPDFMLRWLPWQGQPLISERDYSLGEVTSWRRSCSNTDTYDLKVGKKIN